MNSHMGKPIDFEELIYNIQRYIKQKTPSSEDVFKERRTESRRKSSDRRKVTN